VHPPHVRAEALELITAGLNDCEVSRRTRVPRRTILDWRRPTYVRRVPTEVCPRCWRPARRIRFTPEDYCELLGLYLGDGYISEGPRTQRLRLHLDAKYPKTNADVSALLERCFPGNVVGTAATRAIDGAVGHPDDSRGVLCSSRLHFPQHGPGKKHERRIILESWQRVLVDRASLSLVRGLIRSDGCAFINRPGPYEYLSYDFSNYPKDIVDLFVWACSRVGIATRINQHKRRWAVRINQRTSVALMEWHVGLKC
jgi:hypothetical protein